MWRGLFVWLGGDAVRPTQLASMELLYPFPLLLPSAEGYCQLIRAPSPPSRQVYQSRGTANMTSIKPQMDVLTQKMKAGYAKKNAKGAGERRAQGAEGAREGCM